MSDICLNFVQDSSTPLIDIFNNSLETTLNEHAPLKSLLVTERFNTNWYNDICANSKRNLRKLERKYRITKSTDNCLMFTVARRKHNRLLHITRSTYNKNCIINCNHNLKDMFVICNKFLGRKVSQVHSDLPSVEYFVLNLFATKIKNIIDTLPCPAYSVTKTRCIIHLILLLLI